MDVSAWVSLVSAAVSALAAVGGGIYTRSQARTATAALTEAKRSAIADIRSSYAALDSARSDRESVALARATLDREDRPDFEYTVIHSENRAVVGITLKSVSGPPRVVVDAVRTTNCSWPDGTGTSGRMYFERGPHGVEVRRGEQFGFPAKTDPRADSGTTIADLYCRDATDDTRGWECPVVIEWDRRPPTLHL